MLVYTHSTVLYKQDRACGWCCRTVTCESEQPDVLFTHTTTGNSSICSPSEIPLMDDSDFMSILFFCVGLNRWISAVTPSSAATSPGPTQSYRHLFRAPGRTTAKVSGSESLQRHDINSLIHTTSDLRQTFLLKTTKTISLECCTDYNPIGYPQHNYYRWFSSSRLVGIAECWSACMVRGGSLILKAFGRDQISLSVDRFKTDYISVLNVSIHAIIDVKIQVTHETSDESRRSLVSSKFYFRNKQYLERIHT